MKLIVVHGKLFASDGTKLEPITNAHLFDTEITSKTPDLIYTGWLRVYVQRDAPELDSKPEREKTVSSICKIPMRDTLDRLHFIRACWQFWNLNKKKVSKEQARRLLKKIEEWIRNTHPLHLNVISYRLDPMILEIADRAKVSLFSDGHRELSYYMATVKVMEPEKKDAKRKDLANSK